MRLTVRHLTRYAYDVPVQRAALRLKLFPSRFASQAVLQWSVSVNGVGVAPLFTDQYGDGEAIWTSSEGLNAIDILAEGAVETSSAAGVVRGLPEPARPGLFLRTTSLTTASAQLEDLARASEGPDTLSSLHTLCDLVRDAVDYVQLSTDAQTSAADALKRGRGVCQDHAHIFIAAARLRNVPARYIAGYLLSEGEEQTHAWAEAYVTDLGWVGFDPSNRQCPTEHYVRLCAGLDAADAAPVRGCVNDAQQERLSVAVDIAAGAAQQQ